MDNIKETSISLPEEGSEISGENLLSIHYCDFGCGQIAKYKFKSGKWCCSKSSSACPVIKKKNSDGLKRAHKRSGNHYDSDKCIIKKGIPSWNKGLTSKTDERVAKIGKSLKEGYKSGKLKAVFTGKKHSKEAKEKIRLAALKAHAEGRAHNIGECRWNNKPSWPEEFFMKVISNEFSDKCYVREMPFHKFSLDFAWVHKKKCIEIDGEQHQYGEQPRRDKEKDNLLLSEGWKILRIKWVDMYKESKKFIKLAKEFIDNN